MKAISLGEMGSIFKQALYLKTLLLTSLFSHLKPTVTFNSVPYDRISLSLIFFLLISFFLFFFSLNKLLHELSPHLPVVLIYPGHSLT